MNSIKGTFTPPTTHITKDTKSSAPVGRGEEEIAVWYWPKPWDLDGAATMRRSETEQAFGPMVRLILDRQNRVWAEFWSFIQPEASFPFLQYTVQFSNQKGAPPLTEAVFETSIDNHCDNGQWPFASNYGPAGRYPLNLHDNPDLWKSLEWARPIPDYRYRPGTCIGGRRLTQTKSRSASVTFMIICVALVVCALVLERSSSDQDR